MGIFNYRILRHYERFTQIIYCIEQGISFNTVTSDTIQKYNKKTKNWKTIKEGKGIITR